MCIRYLSIRISRFRWSSIVALVLIGVAVEQPAQAYVDPGSGTLLLQFVVAAFMGVLFQGRKLTRFYRRLRSPHKD